MYSSKAYIQKDIPGVEDFLLLPFSIDFNNLSLNNLSHYSLIYTKQNLFEFLQSSTGFHLLAKLPNINNISQALLREKLETNGNILSESAVTFWIPILSWAEISHNPETEIFHTCFNVSTYSYSIGPPEVVGIRALQWWIRFFESQNIVRQAVTTTTTDWLEKAGFNMKPKL